MIKNDPVINSLIHENVIEKLVKEKNITVKEATAIVSSMSFKDYHNLIEAAPIVPPSGQPIAATQPQKAPTAAKTPDKNVKAIWPGSGAPIETGMAVGIRDPKGIPSNAVVTQVDKSANGVKVKTPQGKEEWYNTSTLQPGMAASTKPGQQPTTENLELTRLKKLAGIMEQSSAGASCAANMSVGVVEMGGSTIRRQTGSEKKYTREYTPESAPQTIVGDTKPNQASGELSATLAKNGKKTASRKNNGFKK